MPDFGIGEAIATFLATDVGLGATAGAIGADALLGAGGGALLGAITGGDPGLGALGGALGGAGFGAGGAFAGDLGLSVGAGEALGGAVGGLAGAEATGSNPWLGLGLGALPGLGSVALNGGGFLAGGAAAPSPLTGAAGPSAAGAAPVPLAGGGSPDLTALGGGSAASDFSGLGTADLSIPGPGGIGPTADFGLETGGNASGFSNLDSTVATAGGGGTSGLTFDQQVAANPTGTNFGAYPQTIDGQPAPWAGGGNSILNAIHDPTWGNIGKAALNNAGPILSGGLLLNNLTSNNTLPGLDQLKGIAGQLNTSGAGNQGYLQSGTLPPGAAAGLKRAEQSAEAGVRSRYAQLGESGSTAEATDIANAKLDAQGRAFQVQESLLNTGVQQTGLAADVYAQILGINQKQNQETQQAIASFAAALAGGGGSRLNLA